MGDPDPQYVVVRGQQRTIAYAVTAAGRAPAREFLNSDEVPVRDKAVLARYFELLAAEGRIRNSQKFKKLKDQEIWEFRAKETRIGAFADGRVWLLTHGFIKKANPWPREQLDRANAIRSEYLARTRRDR